MNNKWDALLNASIARAKIQPKLNEYIVEYRDEEAKLLKAAQQLSEITGISYVETLTNVRTLIIGWGGMK